MHLQSDNWQSINQTYCITSACAIKSGAATHSEMLMDAVGFGRRQLCPLSRLSLTPLLSGVAKELLEQRADYVLHVIYCLEATDVSITALFLFMTHAISTQTYSKKNAWLLAVLFTW